MLFDVNLHQSDVGKQSIGGIATAKTQTTDLNLGFPSAYAALSAARGMVPAYFPVATNAPMQFWEGTDLQSRFHQQKKEDANRMAESRIQSMITSRARYCSTPHGMGDLPKAHLGERRFANPTFGALILNSARATDSDAPFRDAESNYTSQYKGGVLRSAEGQAYGRRLLQGRIQQLNAIGTAKSGFKGVSFARPSSGATTQSIKPISVTTAIELNLLFQTLLDSLSEGSGGAAIEKLDKFDLATAGRILGLVFRIAPDGDSDFLEDTQGKVQAVLELVDGILDEDTDSSGLTATARETALSLQVLFTKLNEYIKLMIGGAPVMRQETRFNPLTGKQEQSNVLSQQQGQYLSGNERMALSKNLVSSLGFTKLLKYANTANDSGLLSEAQLDGLFSAQQQQRYMVGDMDDAGSSASFSRSARTREDGDHDAETGVSRSDRTFDEDERLRFGMNSGMYFPNNGRGASQFFDDDADVGDSISQAPSRPPPRGRPPPTLGRPPPTLGRPPPLPLSERGTTVVSRGDADSGIVSAAFDPETNGFNVANPQPQPPHPAGVRIRGDMRGISANIPSHPKDLPRSREGFLELARTINTAGGISGVPIRINAGSSLENIRRNFMKRLNLTNSRK
jgi:hypothetical protein